MQLLLCGLSGFFFCELVKAFLPVRFRAKLVAALIGSFGIAILWQSKFTVHELVIYGFSGAGLAVVIHRTSRLARVSGDWFVRLMVRNR